MEKLRVCCLAWNAYPAIEPAAIGSFGGLETHAWSLARGLARYENMDVSLLVRTRKPLRDQYNGVKILHRHEPFYSVRQFVSAHAEVLSRFPWLRILRWSPGLLWRIALLAAIRPLRHRMAPLPLETFFRQLETDVFCCFGVHGDAASFIAAARATGRRSVLFLEANSDLDEQYYQGSTYRSVYGESGDLCWRALQEADQIVAQTPWQQQVLKRRFGRDSVVILNPVDLDEWQSIQTQDNAVELPEAQGLNRLALWIGRADTFHKRPLLCLELAQRCPDVDFLMVLNAGEADVADRMRRELPSNVRIMPQVTFARMPILFRSAELFVTTSSADYEGFPNVLLQAAASGVPIASLEIDYGFIERCRCGLVAQGNLDQLAEYVRAVWNDPQRRQVEGANGREYVRRHHALPAIVSQLANLLSKTAGTTP